MSSKRNKFKCRQRGFSLLELMVTVAVLAIVAGVAAPSFRSMQMRSRLTAAANELNAVLQTARMEAVKSNGRVELCPSSNGSSCDGNDWKRLIVVAKKGNVETVLQEVSLNGKGIEISASSNIGNGNKIWYQADGLVRVGGNAGSAHHQGVLSVCIKELSGENARYVQMHMGRISTARRASGNCGAPTNF